MKKYLRFIILLAIAIAILWYFGRNLDWQQVSHSLRQAQPFYLVIAVIGISLGYLLRAIRWKVLLAPITETSLKELFATTTVGFTAVFFIGRMGEFVRPMWLPMRDKRVRPSAALATIGVERIFDLAALVSFFSINLLWITPPIGHESEFENLKIVGALFLLGVVLGFFCLFIYLKFSESVIGWFERLPEWLFISGKIKRVVVSLLKQLTTALTILQDWREVVSVSFWTISLWLAIALPTWFVLLAFDLPLDFSHSLFLLGFTAVSSVIPTPGGAAGAFHAVTAVGLIYLLGDAVGVIEQAAAVSIVMHLVYFAPALLFGLYYFIHGDITIDKLKRLLLTEDEIKKSDAESSETDSDQKIS